VASGTWRGAVAAADELVIRALNVEDVVELAIDTVAGSFVMAGRVRWAGQPTFLHGIANPVRSRVGDWKLDCFLTPTASTFAIY